MIVVVGLAVAVLVGIAAAFYFTVRRGSKLGLRVRGTGSGRGDTEHALVGAPRAARPSASGLGPDGLGPGGLGPDNGGPAERLSDDTDAEATARARKRVGWRKGADVDEELWPTEGFGGISDEQFWDDLASDKPLATTARTAQTADSRAPEGNKPSAQSRRPGNLSGYTPGAQPAAAAATTQFIPAVRSAGTAAPPAPPATQPVPVATQPVPVARPLPTGTQPVPVARPAAAATQPVPVARPLPTGTQPVPTARPAAATQPVPTARPAAATQPVPTARPTPTGRSGRDHADPEPRGRGPARHGNRRNTEEDPLTSAAFALRASGPVDGHSFQRPGGSPRPEQSAEGGYRHGNIASYGGTSPYPAPGRPYREPVSGYPGGGLPGTSGPPGANGSAETSRTRPADSASAATPPYGFGGTQASTSPPANSPNGRDTRREPNEPPYPNGKLYPSNAGYQGSSRQGYPSGGRQSGGYASGGRPSGGYPGRSHPADGNRRPIRSQE